MAGKLRHWKEKDGRFWARIAVPTNLRAIIGKSEIIEPLGGDRRAAVRNHPAAVARLQAQITEAEAKLHGAPPPRTGITTADFGQAVWTRYAEALAEDEAKRSRHPSAGDVEAAKVAAIKRLGDIDITDPLAVLDASLDYLVARESRQHDTFIRTARLEALRRDLAAGETHLVTHEVEAHLNHNRLSAGPAERAVLAKNLMRSEIEALERTVERDSGDYGGKPSDPVVRPPAPSTTTTPVRLLKLWDAYVASRIQAGYMKDRGKRQEPVIKSLIKFLGHDDAAKVTRLNLLDWRDHLLTTLSLKTTRDIYLSTIQSLFRWATENERLPENMAASVDLPKPKKVFGRVHGYTDEEALVVLKAARGYQPKPYEFGHIQESERTVIAKRWVPLLCAFTGARVSEITQLRREDLRQVGKIWVARITPEAGSVKTDAYRDVPLHR